MARRLPPGIRKLPSGKYQATVRHPSGKRITKTDPLMGVVERWRTETRASFARGEVRDPRAGKITVAEWFERWWPTRGIAATTKDRDESRWRIHCEPQWSSWPMQSITRLEAQAWVRKLETQPWHEHRLTHKDATHTLGAQSVIGCVSIMHQLFKAAMREFPPIVTTNPFADLELPKVPPQPIRFYTRDEADLLVAAITDERWRVLVEMGMWVGLRWQELAGLSGARVDWLRGEVHVTHVWTKHGTREYPKSRKSHRVVPVPDATLRGMSRLMRGRAREELVFVGERGGLSLSRFYQDAWYPAIGASGVPRHSPHVMRHTAASWLVQDGVDLYRVQALLGHESFATTQRYAHLQPGAHDVIRESWKRRDARRAHEPKRDLG